MKTKLLMVLAMIAIASARSISAAPPEGCVVSVTFDEEFIPPGYIAVSQFRGEVWILGIGTRQLSSKLLGWAPRELPVRLPCAGDPYFLWWFNGGGGNLTFLGELEIKNTVESLTIGLTAWRERENNFEWLPFCSICTNLQPPALPDQDPRSRSPRKVTTTSCQTSASQWEYVWKSNSSIPPPVVTQERIGNAVRFRVETTDEWELIAYPDDFFLIGENGEESTFDARLSAMNELKAKGEVIFSPPRPGVYCFVARWLVDKDVSRPTVIQVVFP